MYIFVSTVKFAVCTLVGVFVGTSLVRLAQKASTFVGIFVDIFVYTPMRIFVSTLVRDQQVLNPPL